MDKKEYIVRQLERTRSKKYEAYVVNRIIHLLNDFNIKFVTQQYVSRPEGRALTDLFFPQLNIHIEVDEPHHKVTIEDDRIREADIINATNHEILRIDVANSIEDINSQTNGVVEKLRSKIEQLKNKKLFIPWDINMEFDPQTHIERGYIDVSDNVAFRTIKDACNCFGHEYRGYQQAGARHPYYDDIMLWFPKLFPNEPWINEISSDERIIKEKHQDAIANQNNILRVKERTQNWETAHKRIVFAKVKDNLGNTLYRFKGLYELNPKKSQTELVWERKETSVKTFSPKQAKQESAM